MGDAAGAAGAKRPGGAVQPPLAAPTGLRPVLSGFPAAPLAERCVVDVWGLLARSPFVKIAAKTQSVTLISKSAWHLLPRLFLRLSAPYLKLTPEVF